MLACNDIDTVNERHFKDRYSQYSQVELCLENVNQKI